MAGETTTVAATAARTSYQNPGAGAYWVFFNLSFSTTQNETNDVMQAGYIAPNTRVLAVGWYPTDMDTNVSPAVVHKVTVNSVDVVTGLTGAQLEAILAHELAHFVRRDAWSNLVPSLRTSRGVMPKRRLNERLK